MKFLSMCIILISFFSLRIFGVHALSTSINTQYSTNNAEIKQLYIVSSTSKPTLTTSISTTQTTLSPTVILDGKRLIFEIEPSIQDGRTLVPLRAIFEALGANVNWEEKTKTITATKKIIEKQIVESKKNTTNTTEQMRILRNYAADLDKKAGVNQPKSKGKPVQEKASDEYIRERSADSYKPKTKNAESNSIEIKINIGNSVAYMNGKAVQLDIPAIIVDGRTLVPLRFVSQSLGAQVAWDGNSRTITINSK